MRESLLRLMLHLQKINNEKEICMKTLIVLFFLVASYSTFAVTKTNEVTSEDQETFFGDEFEQPFKFKGEATLINFPLLGINEVVLAISGEAAKGFFDGIEGAAEEYENTCEGKDIKVQKKVGKSLSCEQWPAECWGKVSFKCESKVDLEQGLLEAR